MHHITLNHYDLTHNHELQYQLTLLALTKKNCIINKQDYILIVFLLLFGVLIGGGISLVWWYIDGQIAMDDIVELFYKVKY